MNKQIEELIDKLEEIRNDIENGIVIGYVTSKYTYEECIYYIDKPRFKYINRLGKGYNKSFDINKDIKFLKSLSANMHVVELILDDMHGGKKCRIESHYKAKFRLSITYKNGGCIGNVWYYTIDNEFITGSEYAEKLKSINDLRSSVELKYYNKCELLFNNSVYQRNITHSYNSKYEKYWKWCDKNDIEVFKPKVIIKRTPENKNTATFDFVELEFVALVHGKFDNSNDKYNHIGEWIINNKTNIITSSLKWLSDDKKYNKYNVPTQFIRPSNIMLRRDNTVTVQFELKEIGGGK